MMKDVPFVSPVAEHDISTGKLPVCGIVPSLILRSRFEPGHRHTVVSCWEPAICWMANGNTERKTRNIEACFNLFTSLLTILFDDMATSELPICCSKCPLRAEDRMRCVAIKEASEDVGEGNAVGH